MPVHAWPACSINEVKSPCAVVYDDHFDALIVSFVDLCPPDSTTAVVEANNLVVLPSGIFLIHLDVFWSWWSCGMSYLWFSANIFSKYRIHWFNVTSEYSTGAICVGRGFVDGSNMTFRARRKWYRTAAIRELYRMVLFMIILDRSCSESHLKSLLPLHSD